MVARNDIQMARDLDMLRALSDPDHSCVHPSVRSMASKDSQINSPNAALINEHERLS